MNIPAPVLHCRATDMRPSSWDAEALTVEAVAATSAPVRRRDARGDFLEVLDMAGLDLGDAEGIPVFDDHQARGTRSMAGVAEGFRVEGDRLLVTLRLSSADDAAPIRQRIADGTARFVSVGYRVDQWREGRDASGRRTRTATRWGLVEV